MAETIAGNEITTSGDDMEKLTAREKVGVWCLLFLARWMLPKADMAEDMKDMLKRVDHLVNCML